MNIFLNISLVPFNQFNKTVETKVNNNNNNNNNNNKVKYTTSVGRQKQGSDKICALRRKNIANSFSTKKQKMSYKNYYAYFFRK